jgi:hypothetical protein
MEKYLDHITFWQKLLPWYSGYFVKKVFSATKGEHISGKFH